MKVTFEGRDLNTVMCTYAETFAFLNSASLFSANLNTTCNFSPKGSFKTQAMASVVSIDLGFYSFVHIFCK